MKYTVNQMPWYFRSVFWLFGYGLGFLFFLLIRVIRLSCHIKITGQENLERSSGHILAMWHHENMPAFVADIFRISKGRYILINHPAWYMKPVHIALRRLGVQKLSLGSTGCGGQKAADEVAQYLKQGWSTHINPDGPAGPPKILRRGVLHMARQSGVPIIAVKAMSPRQYVFSKTWDGKRLPLPFNAITIVYEEPIFVTEHNFEQSEKLLIEKLG
ncbi:MAG: hypothetical protein HY537_02890 [Deltaproteobacteria bacterium]|nr:hypothetical protein [Deltaproteobacteria bacterium]